MRDVRQLGAALSLFTVATSVITIPLAAAEQLALPRPQITAWIVAIYGLPSVLGLVLALRYRQPLLLTGNIFVLIFIVSLNGRLGFAELAGAAMAAGAVVIILNLLGLNGLLAEWVPAPVVMGLLAGSVLPFVTGIFTVLGQEPIIIGGAFAAYLLSSLFLSKVPPIFAALVVALVGAAVLGRFGSIDGAFRAPLVEPTLPVFSWESILTVTPVLVVLIVLQANGARDIRHPCAYWTFSPASALWPDRCWGRSAFPCPCRPRHWWPAPMRGDRNTDIART
jgi:benzoate membrane transport protein